MNKALAAAVLAAAAFESLAVTPTDFAEAGVLGWGAKESSSTFSFLRQVEVADAAADDAWCALASRTEYDARRLELRRKMLAACGTFPERTPLNARTVARYEKRGYSVEKVIFESMPGIFVTGNLFLPDGSGKRAAIVMSCGHADEGKDCKIYRRACVLAVEKGFVAFMFDPFFQGERRQRDQKEDSTRLHNELGLRANLLDWSMPLLRIWDGMRAIDYVMSRTEVDPMRIGYMGQSGGGTMTALMMAADPRIRAACPSCYLTSFRTLCDKIGPQDAEQNIFGQLAFGLNHTGYVLIPDIPIAVTAKFGDMFPFAGVQSLMRTVRTVESRVGIGSRTFLNCVQGPHGWTEATEQTSVDFLAKALLPGHERDTPDLCANRMKDFGYDIHTVDLGLTDAETGCTADRCVEQLPGAKTAFGLIAERATAVRARRKAKTLTELCTVVARLAKIRHASSDEYVCREFGFAETNGIAMSKLAVVRRDTAESLPAVLFARGNAMREPVLVVAYGGRAEGFRLVGESYLAAGHPVMLADLTGIGEVGKEMHIFYGRNDRPDEGLGAMCYLMGEPLVGKRAGDLLIFADILARKYGRPPRLVATGPLAIAAAHAYGAEPDAFSGMSFIDPPPSWQSILEEDTVGNVRLTYADLVPCAYLEYDWIDLVPVVGGGIGR